MSCRVLLRPPPPDDEKVVQLAAFRRTARRALFQAEPAPALSEREDAEADLPFPEQIRRVIAAARG